MPRWNPWAGRGWAKYRRRYSIAQSFQEILTGVLPTVGLDRFWHRDYTDQMFAGGAQSWSIFVAGDPPATEFYHSVALHNPTISEPLAAQAAGFESVELLVYKMEAWIGFADPAVPGRPGEPLQWGRTGAGAPVRFFTVPNTYYDNSTAVVFTPSAQGGTNPGILHGWLQMGVGPDPVSIVLPQAHLDVGVHNIHPIIGIGPNVYDARGPFLEPVGANARSYVAQDGPFLRLKPGQRLVAQSLAAFTTGVADPVVLTERALFASFWWVERPYSDD